MRNYKAIFIRSIIQSATRKPTVRLRVLFIEKRPSNACTTMSSLEYVGMDGVIFRSLILLPYSLQARFHAPYLKKMNLFAAQQKCISCVFHKPETVSHECFNSLFAIVTLWVYSPCNALVGLTQGGRCY